MVFCPVTLVKYKNTIMKKIYIAKSLLILAVIYSHPQVFAKDEVSIKALKAKEIRAELTFEETLYQNDFYDGTLMSYKSDDLKVFALVNRPTAVMPDAGYPVLVFGHGFHPEPKKYGVTASGEISRPGDYYRGIPESYAAKGFLALTPDYRGHNISEGFEFTKTSYLASSHYASDVLHLLAALPTLENVASLWAPVVATTDEQALYYGKYYDETIAPGDAKVDSATIAQYTQKIDKLYAELAIPATKQEVDPVEHLDKLTTPLIIHHARGDRSVPYSWSESFVVDLASSNKEFEFHVYDSDNHLFAEPNRQKAVDRDIAFFNRH